ncbi:hypothetical protein IEO21_00226 [Rhodonia placenta]|uniref:Uncharacterized protein n=1 Tax=Rhodonia placenta TaxID=104341 RepID=A0A8H7PCB5_9APHY|nr:hypothetical protein IEO21_00226 [Postia placenta]
MGFGSCTVSIFPCSTSALGLGGRSLFFWPLRSPNPNLMVHPLLHRGLYSVLTGIQ